MRRRIRIPVSRDMRTPKLAHERALLRFDVVKYAREAQYSYEEYRELVSWLGLDKR